MYTVLFVEYFFSYMIYKIDVFSACAGNHLPTHFVYSNCIKLRFGEEY